jgi:membrane protein DedA with SNARE-associated domain
MRSFTKWVLATFTSPLGVFVLAALDSTLFFSVPFGIDAAVIIVAARSEKVAWLVPFVASAGSIVGAALTFWMGAKIGDKGLERYVPENRLAPIRDRIQRSGAIALAVADLIPPPFPFTAVVLAAGALDVSRYVFFVTLFASRMLRFGVEALLAVWFGKRILVWLESDLVQNIITGLIVLAVVLTIIGLVKIVRSSRPTSRRAAA